MTLTLAGRAPLTLRPYQEEAIDRTLAALDRGVRRQLGVAATGLGKTVVFCALAERMSRPTLVLAHRDELITQAAAKVLEVWDLPATRDAHVLLRSQGHQQLMQDRAVAHGGLGIVKAAANDVGAFVAVASVQTLSRQRRLDMLTPGRFGLVVVDEAHHAAADSYRRVLDRVCDEQTLVLGVTATPDRGDGRGLDDLFDEIVWSFDILWGIRSGYLCDVRGKAVRLDVDMAQLRVRRGDYDAGQAGEMLEAADAPRLIADAWLAEAKGRRTLVFTPTVATAEAVRDEFKLRGVSAAYVHGGTPLDDRRALLRAFEDGRIDVMANCAVLTEGYDNPRVDCIVIARPTKSRALYTQMIGRGTRRHPEKADCLVLDVVGASDEHNLVTIPSLFGLPVKSIWHSTDTLTAAITAYEEHEIKAGRLRAEEVELFRQLTTSIAWAETHDRATGRKRYVKSLGKGKPTVVLAPRDEQLIEWVCGLLHADSSKRVLIDRVSLEMAQAVGEDYIRKSGVHEALTDPNAKWRSRRPTTAQINAARKWRLKVDPTWNAGQLSEALDAHIADVRSRPKGRRRS